jgi:hypothetical protein
VITEYLAWYDPDDAPDTTGPVIVALNDDSYEGETYIPSWNWYHALAYKRDGEWFLVGDGSIKVTPIMWCNLPRFPET